METTHFEQLPEGVVNVLTPWTIQALMTGAYEARQDQTGVITLTYADGEEESRESTKDLGDFETFFDVVEYVQAGRYEREEEG